ncbi:MULTISPECIES: hypothetical protein [unclassified Bradyrhizobium]|uniref:hypothetical protein n=1 Tax=unclassified Bradyrhizobium TaxID=2631580 RepID=UPI0028E7B2B9|nr:MULTISPECIES: hypothetical protein [unclassified Bradyrhizobium]
MTIERMADGRFAITAAPDELIALGNCLNEVCNGIELFELETRVGTSRETLAAMLAAILSAQDRP